MKKKKMLIVNYNPEWIIWFEKIKLALNLGLIGLDFKYRIEHVGSTSVPNLDSKPIIDIDIVYQKEIQFNEIKLRLMEIGYYHNGNQGIEKREVFKRNGTTNNKTLDQIKHHLYVCPIDSQALNRHILSREALRNNKNARIEYQKIKYKLAVKANQNQKLYAELKELYVNDFIDRIIEVEKTK